jgi:hypothetical protein
VRVRLKRRMGLGVCSSRWSEMTMFAEVVRVTLPRCISPSHSGSRSRAFSLVCAGGYGMCFVRMCLGRAGGCGGGRVKRQGSDRWGGSDGLQSWRRESIRRWMDDALARRHGRPRRKGIAGRYTVGRHVCEIGRCAVSPAILEAKSNCASDSPTYVPFLFLPRLRLGCSTGTSGASAAWYRL